MSRITTILSIIFLTLVSYRSYSQYFQSTNYKEGSGLPSSESYMVYQDTRGFIWIGTDNGVVKYDGHEFVTYNTRDGLTDNTVFGFFEDHKGRIWFRTYNGLLSYYENDSIETYRYNAQLKAFMNQSILTNIRYDSLDELHFSTLFEAGTGKVDSAGNVARTSFDEEDWKFISFVGDKMLFVTMPPRNIEAIRIDVREFPIELDDKSNQNNWLVASARWRGKLYFNIYKNIFEYDEKAHTLRKVFTSDEALICLYVDHQDHLWAGRYNSGAIIFKDQSFRNPSSLALLNNISVSSVIQDYEDGTWISTLDQGVFYFPNLTLEHFSLPDTKRVNSVVFGDDEVFLGNYAGDVYRVDDSGKPKLVNAGVAPVSTLFIDDDKRLWISDGAGTQIWRTGIDIGTDVDKRGIVYKAMIQVGDTIIGCTSMGFDKLSLEGKTLQKIHGRKRPNTLVNVNDEIYLGGLNGVDRYDVSLKKADAKIIEYRTASLINVDNRFLIAGTVGYGLFVYDSREQKLTALPIADVTSVYSMVADWPARHLWIGTEKGLFQLDFEKDSTDVRLSHFSKADGLVSTKINSVGRMGNNIWAISDLGISSVPFGHFHDRNFVPKFYIKRIMFESESIAANASVIRTQEKDMVLDVREITFKDHPTLFRYRLNDDEPWRMISGGSIFLADLEPKKYNLEIQASSGNNDWIRKQNLQIDIMANWWETWTFRVNVILALLAIGYAVYLVRIGSIRRRQKYLELINMHQQKLIDSEIRTQERERKRIATDLHDGIGASLSSIKMQVSDAMVDSNEEGSDRAKEINEHLSDVIDDIKRIVYDLHPPGLERYGLRVGMKSLVERLNKSSDLNVIFDYYGEREVVQPVSITIFRILQELINNTMKHARASEIRIHINEFDDEINIMYEDNGIGMVGSRFTGLGLHSIESRVRSLNGRMTWESNHKGTFYNFDIPF